MIRRRFIAIAVVVMLFVGGCGSGTNQSSVTTTSSFGSASAENAQGQNTEQRERRNDSGPAPVSGSELPDVNGSGLGVSGTAPRDIERPEGTSGPFEIAFPYRRDPNDAIDLAVLAYRDEAHDLWIPVTSAIVDDAIVATTQRSAIWDDARYFVGRTMTDPVEPRQCRRGEVPSWVRDIEGAALDGVVNGLEMCLESDDDQLVVRIINHNNFGVGLSLSRSPIEFRHEALADDLAEMLGRGLHSVFPDQAYLPSGAETVLVFDAPTASERLLELGVEFGAEWATVAYYEVLLEEVAMPHYYAAELAECTFLGANVAPSVVNDDTPISAVAAQFGDGFADCLTAQNLVNLRVLTEAEAERLARLAESYRLVELNTTFADMFAAAAASSNHGGVLSITTRPNERSTNVASSAKSSVGVSTGASAEVVFGAETIAGYGIGAPAAALVEELTDRFAEEASFGSVGLDSFVGPFYSGCAGFYAWERVSISLCEGNTIGGWMNYDAETGTLIGELVGYGPMDPLIHVENWPPDTSAGYSEQHQQWFVSSRQLGITGVVKNSAEFGDHGAEGLAADLLPGARVNLIWSSSRAGGT